MKLNLIVFTLIRFAGLCCADDWARRYTNNSTFTRMTPAVMLEVYKLTNKN